jgi:hypothetical protein
MTARIRLQSRSARVFKNDKMISNVRKWTVENCTKEQFPSKPSLSSQQRVVILCSTFWGVRNAVHSGLLKHLKSRNVKTILILGENGDGPLPDVTAETEETAKLLRTPILKSERGMPLLDALLNASFARRYQNSSYPIFAAWGRRNERGWLRLRSATIELLSRLGCRDSLYYWQIENLDRFRRRTRDYTQVKEQLKALRPVLVISTKCTEAAETSYIRAAQDLGIRTLNWVLSFDNLTSRGRLPLFDYYAVWNQRMKEQVLRLYGERKLSEVQVTGTPQFDFHVRPELQWGRDATLHRLGLNGNDRYLLYAGNCAEFTPSEPELIEQFSSRCAGATDLHAHRIVVRLHPLDDHRRWERFDSPSGRIVISRPRRQNGDDFGIEDQALLVNTLVHADTCINMASTMSLDAAVVDTPVVCVAFAGERGGAEDGFCRQVYRTEHYRPLIESGGLRLAHDLDQLVAEVSAYVQNPERDYLSRQELVRQEIGQVDGHASERVAALVARISRETLLQKAAYG